LWWWPAFSKLPIHLQLLAQNCLIILGAKHRKWEEAVADKGTPGNIHG